jgi:hypothetical protein
MKRFGIVEIPDLIAIGFISYSRFIVAGTERKTKVLAVTASAVLGILLVLSLVTDVLGAFTQ